MELPVVSRASWSAAPAGPGLVPHRVVRLSVHHTASSGGPPGEASERVARVQRYHQRSKGWADIAYHFLISSDGRVHRGRDPAFRGDTATSYDTSGHFLACLEGNFEEQQPTEEALEALSLLLAWASREFEVPPETLSGHRDHAATACPGEHVQSLLEDGSLLARLRAKLDGGPIVLVEDPEGSPN